MAIDDYSKARATRATPHATAIGGKFINHAYTRRCKVATLSLMTALLPDFSLDAARRRHALISRMGSGLRYYFRFQEAAACTVLGAPSPLKEKQMLPHIFPTRNALPLRYISTMWLSIARIGSLLWRRF